ncbi:hypothetical protein [Paeniglutamicibacter terrestris]|jgi:hypothetical protein|uniref:Tetratricopeptide repeat protein n=1 Tax=Paeniglutamicibacter terrestris TaxID=2723403 RepID=A0ABX1G3M3_9MICC|nr:hypothetical protein [Paeniglutamicibacter terrestris]ASN39269.1 hypothetical protein CGQ24_09735 [Arthrobacter sp. 7749]NKG20845.1 hypothetical protein [Paeniglutamicibacter terrestris]
MSTATDLDLTHTQALLQIPAGGLASERHNIETGIPGVRLNPTLMRHEISDPELAEAALRSGEPSSQVVILLAKGELRAASELVAETRFLQPQNFAMRVLDTSLTRAAGDAPRAINRLRALITEFKGTAHEAVLQQHLGFAYAESSDLLAAANRFRAALDLRIASNADQHLIEMSRACLESVLDHTASVAAGADTQHPAAVNAASLHPAPATSQLPVQAPAAH